MKGHGTPALPGTRARHRAALERPAMTSLHIGSCHPPPASQLRGLCLRGWRHSHITPGHQGLQGSGGEDHLP